MLLDYWFWVYTDPVTGQRRTTGWRITAIEAQAYPHAQRVPGSLQVRDSEMDFEDTAPLVFHTKTVNSSKFAPPVASETPTDRSARERR